VSKGIDVRAILFGEDRRVHRLEDGPGAMSSSMKVDRQLLLPWRSYEVERRELSVQRLLVEKLDPADRDGRGGSRVLLDILDVQEILSKFFLADEVGGLVIVISELPDNANIGFLSSLRETSELKALDHSLSQFGHSYTSGLICFVGKSECS